jgi:hypothetical protein
MKTLSLINGIWKQKVNPNITKQERIQLNSSRKSNISLMQDIQERSYVQADPLDIQIAESLFNQYKIENAEFISADIHLPLNGVLNYRVDNNHKQIRF